MDRVRARPARGHSALYVRTGRAEDLAGLFVVAVIAASAVVAAVQAVRRLIEPVRCSHLSLVAAAGIVGFVGNEVVAVYRIRVGNRIGSAALRADGLHARIDGLTSLAVVLGAGGIALGYPAADPIVGLIIAVVIAGVLAVAARAVFGRLLDGVDAGWWTLPMTCWLTRPSVRGVRRVRMRWVGHRLVADAELDIDPRQSLADAHDVAHKAEHELVHAMPRLGRGRTRVPEPRTTAQQLNSRRCRPGAPPDADIRTARFPRR